MSAESSKKTRPEERASPAPVVHLAFLWHFHQPCYIDPHDDQIILPWVRLHGISAYSDMAILLEQHERIHTTINISPSLLEQLDYYTRGGKDYYEQVTLRPALELSPEERVFLVRHFFSVHWPGILSRIPRYLELLQKRGHELPQGDISEVASRFTIDELRDLQVLFNLAWFGFSAQKDEGLQQLLDRGRNFTEQDKHTLLDRQHQLLQAIIPRWKGLSDRGSVELTCSPYYHHILPLMVDSNIARRCHPDVHLPDRFCFPQDAEDQIDAAREQIQKFFGVQPVGLWPPEAALSPEVLNLAHQRGVRYLVTDSEVLFHSLDDRGSTPGRRRLQQPYSMNGCTLFFRNNFLSEAIAKQYFAWEDQQAAARDLLEKVRLEGQIARTDGKAPPLVVIALDGETPWETYPNRGQNFLNALYTQLDESPDIRCVSLSEHLEHYPPCTGLEYLHSGSWIESNFALWIGDADKNRAWNLLGRARRRLARAQADSGIRKEVLAQALRHIHRAESSNWFWWMGEPFSSAEEESYDQLFRSHIRAMYTVLGESAPADISRPIAQGGIVDPVRLPSASIDPRIDGTRTSFFEWRGAGFYRVPASGSRYQENSFISGLYWGFNAGRLYFRFDPLNERYEGGSMPLQDLEIWIELTTPEKRIKGYIQLNPSPQLSLNLIDKLGNETPIGVVKELAFREVVEMGVPLARLAIPSGSNVGLSLHFARAGRLLARVPRQGVIEIETPTDDLD